MNDAVKLDPGNDAIVMAQSPAGAAYAVAKLPLGARVEIEVIALA